MQRAVCWYLSCDRYWEETAPSARAFPWPLLLALATGLALALCMCYYIIWIVFEYVPFNKPCANADYIQIPKYSL